MATVAEIARDIRSTLPSIPYLVCARNWIPHRYAELLAAHPSHLVENLGEVTVPGTYTTGTVAITRGTATVTGSGTTFAAAHAGRYIKISGNWYLISTQDSATQLTLASNFAETTVTSSGFTIAPRLITVVANARRFESFRLARVNRFLEPLSPAQFSSQFPQAISTGIPEYIIFHGVDSNNDHTIEAYPYPEEDELLSFTYYGSPPTLTESTSIPDILDPFILRDGAFIDAYNHLANVAAEKGNIEAASYYSNKAAQQRTIWKQTMRAAVFMTTPHEHGGFSVRTLNHQRRTTHRNPIEDV